MNQRHISLRIDDELLAKFRYAAQYNDRSLNWVLLSLIRKYIAEFEKEHEAIPKLISNELSQ